MPQNTILSITNLSISFGKNQVINNISYHLNQNEILGIVGESGSGKSVSSLAILGLLPKKISKITSGSIIYNNEDLTTLSSKAFQNIRGKKIAMILASSNYIFPTFLIPFYEHWRRHGPQTCTDKSPFSGSFTIRSYGGRP